MPRRRLSIAQKLVAIYLIIAVPLIVTLAFAYSAWYRDEINASIADRIEVARLTSLGFTLFLKDIGQAMKSTGGTVLGERYPKEKAKTALSALIPDYPIRNALITDSKGRVRASSDSRLLDRNLAGHPAFAEILQHNALSGIEPSGKEQGTTGFYVTRAIKSKDRLQGIVGCYVDVTRLPDTLALGFKGVGRNIVDPNGHVVFQSQFPQLAKERAYWGGYDFIKKALQGRQATTTGFQFPADKTVHFGAEVPINRIGWAAGSTIPVNEALGPIRRSLIISIMAAAIIGLAALFLGALFARQLLSSLSSLVGKAKAVGEGNFDESALVETGDEVEEVARSMDQTRLNLKRYVEGLSGAAEAGSLLTGSLKFVDVKKAISVSLEKLLGPVMVWILLIDERSNQLKTFLWHSPKNGEPQWDDRELKESEVWRTFENGTSSIREDAELSPPDPILARALTSSKMRSAIELPLKAGEKSFGVLVVGLPTASIESRNEELVKILAAQIAVGLENARLYKIEQSIAETLQQSLLGTPPNIPGFDVGITYAPAYETARIGGDFFDFVVFSENQIGIFIGDVSGKGLKAATLMAMAKHTVRAFAFRDNEPSSVLGLANEVLAKEIPPSEFITLLYGLLDIRAGTMRFSSAGHPAAFHCNERCRIAKVTPGLPLGAFSNWKYPESAISLKPGESLIMYTDGVTEARSGGLLFGDEGIRKTLEEFRTQSAQERAERIVEAARDFAGGKLPDDAAVIVLTMTR